MKLNDEQRKQYYEAQGIDRSDLLSADDITLAELPPDVHLDEPTRSIVAQLVSVWNGLAPLPKIDAAGAMERRVLKRCRSSEPHIRLLPEAWAAYLLLGRIRGGEARRELMKKIGRGELPPTTPRRARGRSSERKVVPPMTDEQRRDAAAFLAPIHARMRAEGSTGVRRETTQETDEYGGTVTIHHIRPTRG